MAKKTTKSNDPSNLAGAIARTAPEFARQMSPRAADLAKALAQFRHIPARQLSMIANASGASDLAKARAGLAEPSKVDLDLPNLPTPIQVSLPRPLPREEGFAEAPPPDINGPKAELTELEITSPERLGLLVRHLRESRKLSQQGFADLAGVGRRFVSELENGKPTLELGKVLKVAQAAGLALFARGRG